jgi:hypothetical protein
MQYSVAVNNARLDAFESAIGTSPKLRLYTGTVPANCAAAATGTLIAEIALPSDWMTAASNGTKAMLGTWSGVGAAAGNVGYFRIVNNAGTVAHMQGTATATGGGGDMVLVNVNVAVNQPIEVDSFTITAGNQ